MANKYEFGVWMDTQSATVVGSNGTDENNLTILAHVESEETSPNSSERTSNNQEQTLQAKFFKEISTHMQNATRIHLTGTGTSQEQFMHYLEDTAQFKNTEITDCTSNKMSDDRLVEFITEKLG